MRALVYAIDTAGTFLLYYTQTRNGVFAVWNLTTNVSSDEGKRKAPWVITFSMTLTERDGKERGQTMLV